jgi:hypothetical protein
MDWFEVVVHVGVTIMAAVAMDGLFRGRGDGTASEVMISLTVAASLVLLAWRRRKALSGELPANPGRIEELEARVAELEQMHGRLSELESGQHRLAELEERLDFAERLLVQSRESAALAERVR